MILPRLLATLTNHPRQQVVAGVDFEWSSKAWVHNCFRAFELIFWRRAGIRVEARTIASKSGIWREFYTIEAALAYLEASVRGVFSRKFVPFRVYIPILSTPFGTLPASPYLFAIAFDAAASGDSNGNAASLTFSHTCTGSNLALTVGSSTGNSTASGNTTDSITYNAVGMTKFSGNSSLNGDNRYNSTLWWQASPSTGANNVIITPHFNPSQITGGAISMTGTSSTPNGATNNATGSSSAPSVATTTTAANSFVVDCLTTNDLIVNDNPTTTGTNQTMRYRQNEQNGGHSNSGSTQTTTTAGSYTQSWSLIKVDSWGMIAGEIIAGTAAAVALPYKALLGVGI